MTAAWLACVDNVSNGCENLLIAANQMNLVPQLGASQAVAAALRATFYACLASGFAICAEANLNAATDPPTEIQTFCWSGNRALNNTNHACITIARVAA